MKKTYKKAKVPIETIEAEALQGKDVNKYFEGGKMMPPLKREGIQRVNVDLSLGMLRELDLMADEMNITRQALIKVAIRRELDHRILVRKAQ